MTRIEDALATATGMTDQQRLKAQASLELFAQNLGKALGKWCSDAVGELLTKRPELVAAIEDDAELTRIKKELRVLLDAWPNKMKDVLLRTEIMSEKPKRQWSDSPLEMVYAAANALLTKEAEPFVAKAFGAHADFRLKRPTGFDFPTSIQHLVQGSWEDFHADQSKLMELAKQQQAYERQLKERDSSARWDEA